MVAVIFQAVGEANVGGAVQQHIVAPGAEHIQRADHAAQHTVFIADVLRPQAGYAVAGFLPADDAAVVFFRGGKVAVSGMGHTRLHGLHHSRNGGKIHIRHPHGDHIKALFRAAGAEAAGGAYHVYRNGILAVAIHDGCKIVFHSISSLQGETAGIAVTGGNLGGFRGKIAKALFVFHIQVRQGNAHVNAVHGAQHGMTQKARF